MAISRQLSRVAKLWRKMPSIIVDFEYWFENVVGYCEFVVSQLPNRVWVHGEKGLTSAYDVDEFLEQALGDRDLENLIAAFADTLRSRGVYEAFLRFCSASERRTNCRALPEF